MHIIHIITRLIRGGADENTLLSCNAQVAAGHIVDLVCGREISAAMMRRLDSRVRVVRVPSLVREVRPLHDLIALAALTRFIKSRRPDIVHTHTSKAGVLGRLAAKAAGVRGIIHGVHILPFLNVGKIQRLVYLGAERMLAPLTSAFVNVSEGMMREGMAEKIGKTAQHVVVCSGMDTALFRDAKPIPESQLAEFFAGRDTSTAEMILLVSALEPRKRIFEFLDVFEAVVRERPNAILVVLGEGADRGRLESKIHAMGLSDTVALIGFRADVERWIARADMCVHASEREGLPRVVVQFALAARPIVCTNLPGVDAVVEHGSNGLLIPPNRIEDMVPAIAGILSDRERARSMAAASRNRDFSAWGVEQMVDALDAIYTEVLSTGLPRGSV